MSDTFKGEVRTPDGSGEPGQNKDYVPNTHSKISSGAVVGSGASERKAPRLMVLYACPECMTTRTLNAYDGVPSCDTRANGDNHQKVFMEGVRLAT